MRKDDTLNHIKKLSFKEIDKEFNILSKKIEKLKLINSFLQFLLYVLSELLANVKEHSRAKNVLIKIKIDNLQAVVNVEDNGIGLRKSYFLKKIYPKDDFAAIEFALSGLSTKDLTQRGFGLFSIRKLVENLDGKMIIKTNKASCLIERNKVTFKKVLKGKSGLGVVIQAPIKDFDFYKIIK